MLKENNVQPAAVTVVPFEALDRETLRTLITEFVGREGTDYGSHEVTLPLKIEQVMRQLQSKEVVITYCPTTETTSIVPARMLSTVLTMNSDVSQQ